MSFPRFVAVGGLCALLSNAAVIVLVRYGFGSLVASLLAFTPVLLIGYALHAAVTFGTPASRVSFGRYAFATLMNFPVWAAALYVFCDLLKVSVAIVAPVATAVIFLWNYMSARWAFLPTASGDD